jgi:hypothetical protein
VVWWLLDAGKRGLEKMFVKGHKIPVYSAGVIKRITSPSKWKATVVKRTRD